MLPREHLLLLLGLWDDLGWLQGRLLGLFDNLLLLLLLLGHEHPLKLIHSHKTSHIAIEVVEEVPSSLLIQTTL